MKCLFEDCKNEFVDNEDGMAAMYFHMMLHPTTEINTREQMFDPESIQIMTQDELAHE